MIVLLRDNSYSWQASWVRQIHGALSRNDILDFLKKLNGINMWGGSGAVWEVGMFQTKKEEMEFEGAIIALVDLMKKNRISHGKANSVARHFRRNLSRK